MKRFLLYALILIICIGMVGCTNSHYKNNENNEFNREGLNIGNDGKSDDLQTENSEGRFDGKFIEPVYENVSRPIKEFWIIRENILVLTESGDLLYGKPDTPKPYFIVGNVKEVKLNSQGIGMLLLENGDVVKVNDTYSHRGWISFYNIDQTDDTCDIKESTYNVNAKALFDTNFYVATDESIRDLYGNILTTEPVSDAIIIDYKTNYGLEYNGLFLYKDGRVEHRFKFSSDKEVKTRTITTKAVEIYFNPSFLNQYCGYCGVVRENGELLCWTLDDYYHENNPCNAINKVASDALTSENCNISFSGSNEVLYVNSKRQYVKYSIESNTSEVLCQNVRDVFYDGEIDLSVSSFVKNNVFILNDSNEIVGISGDEPYITNVYEVLYGGKYINFTDNKCGRLNGERSFYLRSENVKVADSKNVPGSGDVLQVFLKYGGSLYAANGRNSSIYKTAFCESEVSLKVDDTLISPKQVLRNKKGMYLIPYDECCSILGLNGIIDRTANSIVIESADRKLELFINMNKYFIDGNEKELAFIIEQDSTGLIWIPIQVVSETFGFTYEFDVAKSTINIKNK